MFRALILVGLGMALGYGLSVVEVGGRPVAQQAVRLWHTPLVQAPLAQARAQVARLARRLGDEVPRRLQRLAAEAEVQAEVDGPPAHPPHRERDRRQLEAMVEGAAAGPRRR